MRTFTLDDLQAGLVRADRLAARYASPLVESARARRWLDLGDDQRQRFSVLANELAVALDGEGEPYEWARVGGFWHLAGDAARAKPWFKRVARERRQQVEPSVRSGVLYLLGDYRKAQKTGADCDAAWLSEVADSGDVSALPEIRARLARLAMQCSDGPHQIETGEPLTVWDWIEESFLLEARLTGEPVPSHEEMLRRCGVLSDEPLPPPPPPLSPAVGLSEPHRSGGWLEVKEPDLVDISVPNGPHIVLRRRFGLWGVWVAQNVFDDSGDWIINAIYPDWSHAAAMAAEWVGINYGDSQEAIVTELAHAAGGNPGVPVPALTELREPEPLPTIDFQNPDLIEVGLVEDLYVTLREFEGGWSARVSAGIIAPMEDAIPPSCATWQDAARELIGWLREHRGGHGVPELQQLLARAAE